MSHATTPSPRLVRALTLLGALPFWLCVAGALAAPALLDWHRVALSYAAIILSFLCGMQWAVAWQPASVPRVNLLITSNAVTLLGWLSLALPQPHAAYALLALCYLLVLRLDRRVVGAPSMPAWFLRTRTQATVLVVLALAILGGIV